MVKDAFEAKNESIKAMLVNIEDNIDASVALEKFSACEYIKEAEVADEAIKILSSKGYRTIYDREILTIKWS